MMGPLFGVYELRVADAHLAAKDLEDAFALAGIDPQASLLDQGYSLIENVARAIWGVGDVVQRHLRSNRKGAEALDQGE